jgi:hypothetical protein
MKSVRKVRSLLLVVAEHLNELSSLVGKTLYLVAIDDTHGGSLCRVRSSVALRVTTRNGPSGIGAIGDVGAAGPPGGLRALTHDTRPLHTARPLVDPCVVTFAVRQTLGRVLALPIPPPSGTVLCEPLVASS